MQTIHFIYSSKTNQYIFDYFTQKPSKDLFFVSNELPNTYNKTSVFVMLNLKTILKKIEKIDIFWCWIFEKRRSISVNEGEFSKIFN
jgi:hypothetical protein